MTSKVKTAGRKPGDLKSLKEQMDGPIEVFLPSGRREEDGTLAMEVYDTVDEKGNPKRDERPELDEVPFLSKIYYNRFWRTKEAEQKLDDLRKFETNKVKKIVENEDGEEEEIWDDEKTLTNFEEVAELTLELMKVKWELTEDGNPVPCTIEGFKEFGVPTELVIGTLNAIYEFRTIPKASTGK